MKFMVKKLLLIVILTSLVTSIISCDSLTTDVNTTTKVQTTIKNDQESYLGTYYLTEKTVSGLDVSNTSVYDVIILESDGSALFRSLDLYGIHEETASYTTDETTIAIKLGLRTYDYEFETEMMTLTFIGQVDRKDVTYQYTQGDALPDKSTGGGVSFYDELFGESNQELFYNYAPTIMMEGNDTMHIWYCSNEVSENITDYIAYRKGTLLDDGTWEFTDKQLVLGPTEGTWDERHTCDPEVIRGVFEYQEESYRYLMAYLGCVTSDNSRNEVGIAVAKNPEGPWIKLDDINPIANYYTSSEYSDQWAWGYGQPSMISVDQEGEILLFYTKGITSGTFTAVEHWDLSDLDNPVLIEETAILNNGVVNASGSVDVINNASFAYDQYLNRIYVVKEDFPYPEDSISWITGANTIQYIDLLDDDSYPGETLFSSTSYRWQTIDTVTSNLTGYHRNHNMGIITDEYGWLQNPYEMGIVYTMSLTDEDVEINQEIEGIWRYLGTYRLHAIQIDLS